MRASEYEIWLVSSIDFYWNQDCSRDRDVEYCQAITLKCSIRSESFVYVFMIRDIEEQNLLLMHFSNNFQFNFL